MAINVKQEGDCGYICTYAGRQVGVYATSQMRAKELAVEYFKPPKSKAHMISICLAERADGSQATTVLD